MTTFITQILNGLQIGAIYALVALGYSMVYGIISLLNFAHGDVIMVGAYVAWFSMTTLGLHPLVSVLLVIILCALLGMGIEKVAYAPLRSAPRLSLLITAIGISYLLENLAQLIFGSGAKRVPKIISLDTIHIGSFDLSGVTLTTLLVSVACTVLLTILVKKTKIGKAMRAVSEDTDTARLMG
ncbi:MAG: branched-chain amino acid ABC transporter permease, partial [Ruminococcus sp.]|nr:branched-chain amino acid ABC transporter permease [Candidatus Apopatosoma intestinale]